MPPTTDSEPRRSLRVNSLDSNGRDYLASILSWTRSKLESWLVSPSVQPHLQLWHRICISDPRRFNDAVDWINSGDWPKGYFYNPQDLEEDLLLMCLAEGDDSKEYADEGLKTEAWITQELWARTAWRIVHANKGEGELFEKRIHACPAACYGFVIDVLCIVFHSIAFRGRASVWQSLIFQNTAQVGEVKKQETSFSQMIRLPQEEDNVEGQDAHPTATESSDDPEDSEYDAEEQIVNDGTQTPITRDGSEEAVVEVKLVTEGGRHATGAMKELEPETLHLVDETGVPVTGYTKAVE